MSRHVTRAVALLLIGLLPLVLFAVAMLRLLEAQQKDTVETMLRVTAIGAAATVGRQLAEEIGHLQGLGASSALDEGDVERFRREAERVLAARPGWLTISLHDAGARLLDLRMAAGQPLPPVGDPENLAQVWASGQPAVGDLIDTFEGEPFVVVRVPVLRDGHMVYSLSARIGVDRLIGLLQAHGSPPGWIMALADGDHRLIGRTAEPHHTGMPYTDAYMAAALAGERGMFDAHTRDGVPAYGTLEEVPLAGWTVAVAAPKAVVYAQFQTLRTLAWGSGIAALLLALAMSGGMLIYWGRARAREAASAAEARLFQVLQTTTEGVIEIDRDWRLAFINRRARDLGTGGRDITGMNFWEAYPEARGTIFHERYARVMATGQADEFEAFYAPLDRWFLIRAVPTDVGMAIYFTDVTPRKAAEEQVAATLERYRLAARATNDVVWDWDLATDHIAWNEAITTLSGHQADDVQPSGAWWKEKIHPDDRDRVVQGLGAVIDGTSEIWSAEYRFRRADGSYAAVLDRGFVLRDGEGRAVRMVGAMFDLTDRRAAEAALLAAKEEAEKAALGKSKFLAAASHDLRQPMQSLFLFSNLLAGQVESPKARRTLEMLDRSLDSLKGLLDSLLDVSRLDAGVVQPDWKTFRLDGLLAELRDGYAPQAAAKGLSLTVGACWDLQVRSDPNLLGRVLRNFVENALRYTEQGGIRIECHRHGEVASLEVHDTGIGIPHDQLEAIFEEFHQVGNAARDRAQGLGLGLAIVKRLSDMLGHRVRVRSEPGAGSVFAIEVPVTAAVELPEPPARAAS